MTAYSLLDLAPIVQGSSARQALLNARSLAQEAESCGYRRFWMAEHHNMTGIASAATAVALGYVAEGTSRIRVGSGGIMLPNHAPLMVAEQFGTLASLYPGRIDLGLGRAPGTDSLTMQALRRYHDSVDQFPRDVQELQHYFRAAQPDQAVRAIPGEGLEVPLWLLGSSLFSAQLAAALGLPFAFASHFAPDHLMQALELYRSRFRPSEQLAEPYCMAAVPLYAAATEEQARHLMSSVQQQFIALRRGTPGPLKPPVENIDRHFSEAELAAAGHALREAVVGDPEQVREGIAAFIKRTGVNEIMFSAHIFDFQKRLECIRIGARACAAI
ncbi:LLM class flavin-dependent oxidoreductase [Pseudohongiella sp. SYSU M77423]|uniref:LLM class flavin-dependent oxidoreductase n=1 Tax=unclassified Pseudohongiella TaxID=2629611 RepID=UPI001F473B48|nr:MULTISPECIES: LLM class flavin-dependent oxidoreductase [unclassified Pseudohongiella]MDH7944158.1 LLM class flavin-dependent oxidoreductase [Pseudohongiella sp. SYSU M77423]MEC8859364.1 LLM class flavin-dependent oxidoreductase [Pseudomonadota bacterium]